MSFYVLETMPKGEHESARTDVLPEKGFRVGNATRCQNCGEFVSMLSWLPPYRVEMETWGKNFGGLAFFGNPGWLLTSEKFRTVYEANGLSGLSGFEPTSVLKVKKHKKIAGSLPEYFKADVMRSSAEIHQDASGFDWDEEPVCPTCRLGRIIKRWKKIMIVPGTWTGEDIFIARGLPGTYITTERFKQVCEQNHIKNAILFPTESYGRDFYPWENH